jgi:transcriptional regulator with XRE-family HTH domain
MHNAFMERPADRLRSIREERYATAGEAADAIGVGRPTYYGHENGSRGLTPAMGRRYADFFKVPFDWLMTGRGTRKGSQKHPVLELFEAISADEQAEVIEYMEFKRSRQKQDR